MLIPETINKCNWGYAGFCAVMEACTNPEFVKFIAEHEKDADTEPFYFSIFDTSERVFYIHKEDWKWKFWYIPKSECEKFLLEKQKPVLFI